MTERMTTNTVSTNGKTATCRNEETATMTTAGEIQMSNNDARQRRGRLKQRSMKNVSY